MPPTQTISDAVIHDALLASIQNVCRTMLHCDASVAPSDPVQSGAPGLIASAGFGGAVNGAVYLCMEDAFAAHITALILGQTEAEVRMHGFEVMKDAIGEVTNMVAGGFKNRLCDLGFPCMLTLPAILRGQHLTVVTLKGTEHHVFHFAIDGHRLIAEVQLKAE